MIRKLINLATLPAALPLWAFRNACMVHVLKYRLERAERQRDAANLRCVQRHDAEQNARALEIERDERAEDDARAMSLLRGEIARLERDLTAALAGADRLRHGQDIEGDHVCPHAVERDRARQWARLWHGVARRYRCERFEQSEERHRARVNWSVTCGKLGRSEDARKAAEAQLEALRSAAGAINDLWFSGPTFKRPELVVPLAPLMLDLRCVMYDIATGKISDATPPAQDTLRSATNGPGTGPLAEGGNRHGWATKDGRLPSGFPLHNGPGGSVWAPTARPPIEGDYPADPVTQQWASVVERLTKERDHLRDEREKDTLRLESAIRERDEARAALKHADEHYQSLANEQRARNREVLITYERELCAALDIEHRPCGLPPLVERVRDLQREVANLRTMARVPR